MKKDKTVKRFIQYRYKELRTRLFTLSPFKWSICIFFIALLLLVLSFCVYDFSNWASGALVSISCGCFTGLVFYFLSNIRNNKVGKLQKEYNQIRNMLKVIEKITNTAACYKLKALLGSKRDVFEDKENIYLWINKLELLRKQLPFELNNILADKGYDSADGYNLNNYRERLCSLYEEKLIESTILDIHKDLLPLADELQKLCREREDQLMILGKLFF